MRINKDSFTNRHIWERDDSDQKYFEMKEGEEMAPKILRNLVIMLVITILAAMGGACWLFYWILKLL